MPLIHVLLAASIAALAAGAGSQQAPTSVGQDICATCHDALARQFATSAHGRISSFELRGQFAACESCHGAGSEHAESGDPEKIRRFGTMSTADANRACLRCHRLGEGLYWAGSEHAAGEVGCVDTGSISRARSRPG